MCFTFEEYVIIVYEQIFVYCFYVLKIAKRYAKEIIKCEVQVMKCNNEVSCNCKTKLNFWVDVF